MKTTPLLHICFGLFSVRFLAALAVAAVTGQHAWAASIAQQAYLKASNTGGSLIVDQPGDNFGFCVALSGDTMVVGTIGEDSSATGVNGNQSDNSATDSGAVYVFAGLDSMNRLALVSDGSGGYLIRFDGTPSVTYRLQRASSIAGPWDTIDSHGVPASGLIEYHERSPLAGGAFYRTLTP